MPRKKKNPVRQSTIKVGNISGVSGELNIAGGDIEIHATSKGLTASEIKSLFDQLYSAIETRTNTTPADKEDLKAEVEEIQTTVTDAARKNENVDEGFLSRRFRNITRIAPDILDVVVATLGNPLAGMGIAAKKIAEKARKVTK